MSRRKKTKGRKWKAGVKVGCLALGMATAWGGEAQANVISYVSITPATDLTHAFIYYGTNYSSGNSRSLGALAAGETTTFQHEFPNEWSGPDKWDDPEGYAQAYGHGPGYVVIALYDAEGGPGVSLSFPNSEPLSIPLPWGSIFELDEHHVCSEDAVIANLSRDWINNVYSFLGYYGQHYVGPYMYDEGPHKGICETPFGSQATLVNFSDPTYGGVVTVIMVPESAAWMLFIGLAGSVLLWRRDLLGG